MQHEFRDGRVYVHRTDEEKARITDRLRKIEGQVRGVSRMVDEGRYCLEEIQQANAIVAAMREVELMIVSDHLQAGMDFTVESKNKEAAIKDMMTVLRSAIRK